MALVMMKGRKLNVDAIKLLGDMGEVEDALKRRCLLRQNQLAQ